MALKHPLVAYDQKVWQVLSMTENMVLLYHSKVGTKFVSKEQILSAETLFSRTTRLLPHRKEYQVNHTFNTVSRHRKDVPYHLQPFVALLAKVSEIAYVAGSYVLYVANNMLAFPEYVEKDGVKKQVWEYYDVNVAKPNDIDLWLYDSDDMDALVNVVESMGYNRTYASPVSYVYEKEGALKLNLIKPVYLPSGVTYGAPVKVMQGFDFTVARVAIQLIDGTLYFTYDSDLVLDLAQGLAKIKTIQDPLGGIMRQIKYVHKGWRISQFDTYCILQYAIYLQREEDPRFISLEKFLFELDRDRTNRFFTGTQTDLSEWFDNDMVFWLSYGLVSNEPVEPGEIGYQV